MSAQSSLQSVEDALYGLTISPAAQGRGPVSDPSHDERATGGAGLTSSSIPGSDGNDGIDTRLAYSQQADTGASGSRGVLNVLKIRDVPSSSRHDALRALLGRLQELRVLLQEKPYSISVRLALANAYVDFGYPDLCAGEAYKALLLVDELSDASGEYHEQAVEAAIADIEQSSNRTQPASETVSKSEPGFVVRSEDGNATDALAQEDDPVSSARKQWSETAYALLVQSLLACRCLKSAFEYCKRGLQAHSSSIILHNLNVQIRRELQEYYKNRGVTWDEKDTDIEDYPGRGLVRRELYPWNDHEPDRCSEDSLRFLNEQVAQVAPKLEVRATTLPLLTSNTSSPEGQPKAPKMVTQLGVFAREDVASGETILDERSLLTASGRSGSPLCDACSATLPTTELAAEGVIYCEDCDDTPFCSQTCHDLALSTYHPAVCGTDADAIAKDAPPAEAADALYSLLLCRALAMAETQDAHPLDLPEVKFIWGDYHSLPLSATWKPLSPSDPFCNLPRTLPFSFTHNILHPLHFLEAMDINIFEDPRYDTWVLNTLYAKFRGTASARQGSDGRPEVGAVHPLWCLANHSCDPNVGWAWEGSMRFRVREERVLWRGRGERERPGIRRGEEVLGHYCDVELPVKERREWAAGALGGECMCGRCVWEERVEREEKVKGEHGREGNEASLMGTRPDAAAVVLL